MSTEFATDLRSLSGRQASEAIESWIKCKGTEEGLVLPLRSDRRLAELREKIETRLNMGVSKDSAGGILQGAETIDVLDHVLSNEDPIRRVSNTFRTDRGGDYVKPITDDTSTTGELVTEGGSITPEVFSYKAVNFGAYKVVASCRAGAELLEDVAIQEKEIFVDLALRAGRKANTLFTTGHGGEEPSGLIYQAALGKTSAATTSISIDEVWDLVGSLNSDYVEGSVFMCHRNIKTYLKKLKDGSGRYLWRDSGLDEFPIVTNNDMPSTLTAGQRVLLFGNFGKLVFVRDVASARLLKGEETYAASDELFLKLVMRSDVQLLTNTGLKYLQTASS